MSYKPGHQKPLDPITPGARLRAKLGRITQTANEIAEGNHSTADLLRLVKTERDLSNQALDLAIMVARDKGLSWGRIGFLLELSGQAIEQRMRRLQASTHVDNGAVA
jgi:hypothetical protein